MAMTLNLQRRLTLNLHRKLKLKEVAALAAVVVDGERMLPGLMAIRESLDIQRQQVNYIIAVCGGEMSREEQMALIIERLPTELESEREKSFQLEMELEFLKIQFHGGRVLRFLS